MRLVHHRLPVAVAALALSLLAAPNLLAGEGEHGHGHESEATSAFATILVHYERIRQTLLEDETEGLASHAQAIHQAVRALGSDFSAEQAGVKGDLLEQARDLLPAISEAATELGGATDLKTARLALYPLSKALVRYRKLATGELPAVAYCPMAKKSWLQPSGEIGNPYFGQSMPTCGEIVDG